MAYYFGPTVAAGYHDRRTHGPRERAAESLLLASAHPYLDQRPAPQRKQRLVSGRLSLRNAELLLWNFRAREDRGGGMTERKNKNAEMIPIELITVINPRERGKAKFKQLVASIAKVGLKK